MSDTAILYEIPESSDSPSGEPEPQSSGASLRESFTLACAVVVPFGRHRTKTLARIGSNNDGLKYLDWLIGQEWMNEGTDRGMGGNRELKEFIETYLRHASVARQLDAALDESDED